MYKIGESFKKYYYITTFKQIVWEEYKSENWIIQQKQKKLDNLKEKITQREEMGGSFYSADGLEFLKIKYNKKFIELEELKLMEFCHIRQKLSLS